MWRRGHGGGAGGGAVVPQAAPAARRGRAGQGEPGRSPEGLGDEEKGAVRGQQGG